MTGDDTPSGESNGNRLFLSYLLPLFQNESSSKNFHINLRSTTMRMDLKRNSFHFRAKTRFDTKGNSMSLYILLWEKSD